MFAKTCRDFGARTNPAFSASQSHATRRRILLGGSFSRVLIRPPAQSRLFSHTASRHNPVLFRLLRGSGVQLFQRWAASPNFYYQVVAISGGVAVIYVYNLEEVPVSGRKRFRIIPDAYMEQVSEGIYKDTLSQFQGRLLAEHDPRYTMCERVAQRLIPHTGFSSEKNQWKLHVVEDPNERNAFVLPGRQIFVFTGLLKVCKDDDGLATVLGHEMAHNVANHAAEKLTLGGLFSVVGIALSIFLGTDMGLAQGAMNLALGLPNGRKQESEADYIGLIMMSEACYDPQSAVDFWERMGKASEGRAPPELLSTHPNDAKRRASMQGWMNKAELEREKSGCGPVMQHQDDFRNAFVRWS